LKQRNAVYYEIAKERLTAYRKSVTEKSTSPKPVDIILLEEELQRHPDLAATSKRLVAIYKKYPFLLHTNWDHDGWRHMSNLQTRAYNDELITRGGAPVWSAAADLLKDTEEARRMLSLLTFAIRNTCPTVYTETKMVDEEDMKQRLKQLLTVHKNIPPLKMTIERLTEVDMVAFFLAVLANNLIPITIDYGEKNIGGSSLRDGENTGKHEMEGDESDFFEEVLENKDSTKELEVMISQAENNEDLTLEDAESVFGVVFNFYDNANSVDMEQKHAFIQRSEDLVQRKKDTRKRKATDRFTPPTSNPVKRKKTKNDKESSTFTENYVLTSDIAFKVRDEVIFLQEPEERGWINGTISYATKAGKRYAIR
jgi:hypothetical protein